MANKKINQLVSKTAILSTDIFGIGDATTGQLFKKTIAELQAAIGGAVISVNGLVGTVVLDTDDIQELATPTNKYFTDARARGAISLTVTGNSGASTYSSGTGVLNVPTYTLAGLGGITATFLSGTSGISYNSTTGVISYSGTVYTDASIRALLSGSTGISYNSTTGAISYSGTVYTDASVRALISITTTGTSGASTYNNTTGVINVPNYTLAGLGGISLTSLSGGTGITYNNTTGAISYSGTVYTDASVRALISASGVVSYNNTTGVISLTSGNLTEATSSVLTITGGTGAVLGSGTSIQVKQASSSVSGFLSSTDWSAFNGKASALSGTTGYHAKFTSSTTIGNSVIYDDGTNVGIGTASPQTLLTIAGTSQALGGAFNTYGNLLIYSTDSFAINKGGSISLGGKYFSGVTTIETFARIHGKKEDATDGATAGYLSFETTNDANALLTERLRISSLGIATFYGTSGAHIVNSNTTDTTGSARMRASSTGSNFTDLISYSASHASRANQAWIGGDGNTATLVLQTAGVERVRINSTGVGIGTTSPSVLLHLSQNAANLNLYLQNTLGSGKTWAVNSDTNGNFNINDTTTNIFRITNGANILMGTTTDNGERLYVSGAIRATGTITANSDISLKKNLLKIENALEKVEQINGYTYELKEDNSKRHAGVIAQEIQTVLPEIVNKGNDGILGVEYGNISALLIEAIKEQQTQIKELKALLNK